MDSLTAEFQVRENPDFSIKAYEPAFSSDLSKDQGKEILKQKKEELKVLQEEFFVAQNHSLLIILQAMDAAGKDSTIEHVMSGVNPQGCVVHSFKQPSLKELKHDFLWKHAKATPERGYIGIHNRSHYENVIVTRVHPELILAENIAGYSEISSIDEQFWENRYESIRNFEKHLYQNGTIILKFFLNMSKKVQKERFLKRIEDPEKNWKFSYGDIKERRYWREYMKAYETAISKTSFDYAPWYIIPADKKWFSRIAIISIIIDRLNQLSLSVPKLSEQEVANLEKGRKELQGES